MDMESLRLYLDLETTHLFPEVGSIIQVAIVIVTKDLEEVFAAELLVKPDPTAGWSPEAEKMHRASGLYERCEQGVSVFDAETFLLQVLDRFFPSGKVRIGGSSPHFDLGWLHYHMRGQLSARLSHQLRDVTSVSSFFEGLGAKASWPPSDHTALAAGAWPPPGSFGTSTRSCSPPTRRARSRSEQAACTALRALEVHRGICGVGLGATVDGGGPYDGSTEGLVPDFSDTLTRLSLVHYVREAWGQPDLYAYPLAYSPPQEGREWVVGPRWIEGLGWTPLGRGPSCPPSKGLSQPQRRPSLEAL